MITAVVGAGAVRSGSTGGTTWGSTCEATCFRFWYSHWREFRGGWDGRWGADRSCSRMWRRGYLGGTRCGRGWRSWVNWALLRTSEGDVREVAVRDADRIAVARRLAESWPRRAVRRAEAFARVAGLERANESRLARTASASDLIAGEPDWLHADRFSSLPPLLAVHLGAGNAGEAAGRAAGLEDTGRTVPLEWVASGGGRRGGTTFRFRARWSRTDWLRDWTRQHDGSRRQRRFSSGPTSSSGKRFGPGRTWRPRAGTLSVILFSGTNQARQWRPWSRHSLVLRHRVLSAIPVTRRSARWRAIRACRACIRTASTAGRCGGGSARTGLSRRMRRFENDGETVSWGMSG